jgi:RimJ/RimL family protein N-acetyltransferase
VINLREVAPADLPVFFASQSDPGARTMAAVEHRDWEAFATHWTGIMSDERVVARAILVDEEVAGSVLCFGATQERQVGYWIGREYWGRGVATQALSIFLGEALERPLHGHVAQHNVASIRVLEKCGFRRYGGPNEAADGVTELTLRLSA